MGSQVAAELQSDHHKNWEETPKWLQVYSIALCSQGSEVAEL